MKIPKKISPDSIKDSIVEVRYNSVIPFEVIIGLIYKSLDETYMYTNRPLKRSSLSSQAHQVEIQLVNKPLFYNDKIKVELQPNSIIFNSVGEYLSWDVYRAEIEKVLLQIQNEKIIGNYTRVGLRYISEYPNINLKDCIKFTFSFGMPEITSESYNFHSEFNQEGLRVIMNLINNSSIVTLVEPVSQQPTVSQVSYIDIDVIKDNLSLEENAIEELMSEIDVIHKKEKEVFFNLLKDDFLQSLNPIY